MQPGLRILLTITCLSSVHPSIQSVKMIRPRGGITRTLLNKIEKDKQLAEMDKTKWYKINEEELECLSMDILRKFEMMEMDDETSGFIDQCIENSDNFFWQLWVNVATSFLSWFMQPTSINGLLGRGSMQVFSKAQFRALINWDDQMKDSLMDIGAGDGATTSMMSPYFSKVFVTEMSLPMKRVLAQRGFSVLDENSWSDGEREYDMISCLNVLDRCDEPLSLLAKIQRKLSPTGMAVISFVIPFKPYVEFESKTHQPKELLPIKGTSFEIEVVNFVKKVLEPNGWELVKWSRLPYLCEGDIHQAYYWLSDALFLIRPTNYSRGS